LCQKTWRKNSADKNREKYKERYKGRYPKSSRTRKLLGISHAMLRELEKLQNGKCAICGGEPKFPKVRLCVDHCHTTGLFRGLLCGHCNTALGLFKDDISSLKNAIRYLENNGWAL
jgi:hypothetical protein